MKAAVYLYGIASAAAGMMDLLWGAFDSDHQPIQAFGDHIPGLHILAYITAVWMIAGGVAILWRRSARAGGAALALIYFAFTVFWVPRLYTAPHFLGHRISVYLGVLAGLGSQLIVVTAGALVYASLAKRRPSWPRTILFARWAFGLSALDFGLNHLADLHNNIIYVPKWMPLGANFWIILTGVCFVLAGLAILSGIQDVLAGRLLGLMFLAFNLIALPQFIFADPKDHDAWGGYAYNLAAVGASWILSESLARRHTELEYHSNAQPA
jgi:uncharacterized membrane protein YphA (DoxX/SURF4 family)